MVAVFVHAHRGRIALAWTASSQLQCLLRSVFLRRRFFSRPDGVVVAAWHDGGHRYCPECFLLSSTSLELVHAGKSWIFRRPSFVWSLIFPAQFLVKAFIGRTPQCGS